MAEARREDALKKVEEFYHEGLEQDPSKTSQFKKVGKFTQKIFEN